MLGAYTSVFGLDEREHFSISCLANRIVKAVPVEVNIVIWILFLDNFAPDVQNEIAVQMVVEVTSGNTLVMK